MISSYVLWHLDVQETLKSFLQKDISSNTLSALLSCCGWELSTVEAEPLSGTQLVWLRSEQDLLLSSGEVAFLDLAKEIWTAKSCDDVRFFAFELEGRKQDFPCCMAALTKLFSLAFPGKLILLGKYGDQLSLGSLQTTKVVPNNFCQSKLMQQGPQLAELLEELALSDGPIFSDIINAYSVTGASGAKFDVTRFSYEYIDALRDCEKALGVDLALEKARYIASFSDQEESTITREALCIVLENIGEPRNISSYDTLDEVEATVAKLQQARAKITTGDSAQTSMVIPDLDVAPEDLTDPVRLLAALKTTGD